MKFDQWLKKYFKNSTESKTNLEESFFAINKSTAVYALSADPPTWGHADIMMRAAKKFSKVYWVIGVNPKKQSMFSTDQKKLMLEAYIKHYKLENVQVDYFEGSIAKYCKEKNARFLIRGLRSSSDFQMEYELSVGNRGINKELETICMFTKPHYATISSSIVRELTQLDEKISQYVHPEVERLIHESIKK